MRSFASQSSAGDDAGVSFKKAAVVAASIALAGVSLSYAHKTHFDAYDVPIGKKSPYEVPVFVEVQKNSRMKYEWDNSIGFIRLDRVLHSAVFYPYDYGFIPQTLCGDGDPLDVLVLGDDPLQPGCITDVRPIGYMIMEDEKGLDEKVLAVPAADPRYYEVRTIHNLPEHMLREISHFFETYKALERKKWVKIGGWKGASDTHDLIEECHQRYMERKEEEEKVREVARQRARKERKERKAAKKAAKQAAKREAAAAAAAAKEDAESSAEVGQASEA